MAKDIQHAGSTFILFIKVKPIIDIAVAEVVLFLAEINEKTVICMNEIGKYRFVTADEAKKALSAV